MQSSSIPWRPRVGEHVGIKGSRLLGTVVAIEGSGEDQLFTLNIHAPDVADPGVALRLAATALRTPTVYSLDGLVPHP